MRRRLASVVFAAAIGTMALGVSAPSAVAGCFYQGDANTLPTGGLPVLVYGSASTAPAVLAGVGDGTSANYVQVSASGTTGQAEANSATAGQSIWVDSNGNTGSC